MIGYLAKKRASPLLSGLVLTSGVLLLSPTAYPWYFSWTIPFLCFYPSAAWLLMSVTTSWLTLRRSRSVRENLSRVLS